MADIFDQYAHLRPEITPSIYAYEVPALHVGYIKIGYTERDVETRVKEQTHTVAAPYKILLTESAIRNDGTTFTDHDVHAILKHKGFIQLNEGQDKNEWYKCPLNDVKAAILAVKNRSYNIESRSQDFKMRPEQEYAVNMTKNFFIEEAKRNRGASPKFLWNAKMRFGKTFASYELAKKMGMKKILVLTFKPAVESAWEEDLDCHVDFEGWQFYSRDKSLRTGITPERLDQERPIVCFGSFQDFLGVNDAGGIKAKNEWVHATNWDLVIFDEYHFGAWRENAKKLFENQDDDSYDSLDLEHYKKEEADNAYNETFLPITTKYYLFLSGTPFRAINSGEFLEEQIYNWTYSDEQREKENWNGPDNPYEALPKMVLMTYKIPDSIRQIAFNEQYNEFDLNVFFGAQVPNGESVEKAEYIYKDYVQKWLDLIRGSYMPTTVDNLKLGQGQKPVMPYADARLLDVLTHTLWFLPNVASCYAMRNLLAERQNSFYHDYKVNVCAGSSAGIGLAALAPVKASMDPVLSSKTITLSCGKLTTGVTIRPWGGILMLRNLSSPETYFQAAFRVQSPWEVQKDNGTKEIMKKECYVFDFALERALRQVSDYSCRLNINETSPEKKVAEFINFLPVLAYDGATMKPIDATEILDITTAGTSATLLARRWESALLVNVDNNTLQKILDNPDALKALQSIEGFRSLNKDIQTIINRSEAVKKVKKEKGDEITQKEKQELTKEEKEVKSLRKQVQEKLIKFATRVPVFMYLTDFREYCLKDVITQFEPDLFKRVTGLDVSDFSLLVSLGVFNDTLMNEAVYKFKRYEDSSLTYAGISMHAENEDVGLFSTSISQDDYQNMERNRTDTLKGSKVIYTKKSKPVVYAKPLREAGSSASKAAENTSHLNIPEELLEIEETDIRIGMPVVHRKFGKGTIIEQRSDTTITIRFNLGGEKTFAFPATFESGIMWEDK